MGGGPELDIFAPRKIRLGPADGALGSPFELGPADAFFPFQHKLGLPEPFPGRCQVKIAREGGIDKPFELGVVKLLPPALWQGNLPGGG